jgi:hypothetical protein
LLLEVVVPFSINADDRAEMTDEEAVEAQGKDLRPRGR